MTGWNLSAATWDFQKCGMCDQQSSDQPAHTHSLIGAVASRLNILWVLSYWWNIHLEFLSLKGGFTGLSESTHVKMPHCWKSRVVAQITSLGFDLFYMWREYVVCTGKMLPSLVSFAGLNGLCNKWAATWDFQQCGILTSVDSDEAMQSHFKLRNSKWCSVSSLTTI